MLNLLHKDFRLMFKSDKKLSQRLIGTFFKLFFIACFVFIEVIIFRTILKNIKNVSGASIAYMNLFLFIVSILLIISGIFNAYKLFFNEKDIEQLSVHPVPNSSIILSKLVFLFVMHYVTSIIFVYPLFIAYAKLIGKGIWFYYLGLFYPILSFLFEMGISLLLVYPFWLIKKYLNAHVVLKFVVILIIMIVGALIYAKILNIFINIIAGGSVNSLFTSTAIAKVKNVQKFEIPLKFLISAFVERQSYKFFPYIAIALGVFALGLSVAIFAFNYVRSISFTINAKEAEKEIKIKSVNKALIKKELTLLTRNNDYMVSFTGLLIVQPFLAYLVINALDTIFSSGTFAYYIMMVPNFLLLLDYLVLMLFTVIIAQGASNYISMEKSTIKVMKTMPVKYTKQLFIKVIIPFIMSLASLIVTFIVLFVTNIFSFKALIFGIILVSLVLVVFDIVSLKEELSIRHKKPRSTYLSTLYTYLVPLIFFIVTVLLSYVGVSIYLVCIVGAIVILLFGLPFVLLLKRKANSMFMDLDMVN